MKFLFLLSLGIYCFASTDLLEPVKTDHPRDTMRSFYENMNSYRNQLEEGNDSKAQNHLNRAVRTLDTSELPLVTRKKEAEKAAIFLKEVIDRIIVLNYELIPDNKEDPRWRLKSTEISVVRVDEGPRKGEFLISPQAIARAEEFYNTVRELKYLQGSGQGALYRENPLSKGLPSWMTEKFFVYQNWQWLALFILIFIGIIFSKIGSWAVRQLVKFTEKTRFNWDDKLIACAEKPLGWLGTYIIWYLTLPFLYFDGILEQILLFATQVMISWSVIYVVYRMVDVITDFLASKAKTTDIPLDDQLVPLMRKTLKVFTVILGTLIVLQNFGINVMSLIAGLGIGGLAFALAAKDTASNLFGSIMIFTDRPFRVGDWININGIDGTVEEIGFRSTRIRTFYKSQVTVPNSVVANASIDNYGRRPVRRFRAVYGLTYSTTPEQMEAFLEGVKNIVLANSSVLKQDIDVAFDSYGDSSLNVMLNCYLKVASWKDELLAKQNVNLEVLRLAHDLGVDFAFPSQSVYVESMPGQSVSKQDCANEELVEKAKAYGPKGSQSKSQGLGIFKVFQN